MNNKYGILEFDVETYKELNQYELEAIFSKFYPSAIEYTHDQGINGRMKIYGRSPMFDEVEEGEKVPKYKATLAKQYENSYVITKMTKEDE